MGVEPPTFILSMPGRIAQAHPPTTPSTARLITIAHPVLILPKKGGLLRDQYWNLIALKVAVTTPNIFCFSGKQRKTKKELTHCYLGRVMGQLWKQLELMWKFETL